MIVASFLVKDLHVEWQHGARHFMHWLVDGDLASNQHGWQWVAGCGTDAAPYFRVFNPITQGRKFDPDGAYVRRWVPELADPTAARTRTSRASRSPRGYPAPIVDHAEERREALRRWEKIRDETGERRGTVVRELIVPQPLPRPAVARATAAGRPAPWPPWSTTTCPPTTPHRWPAIGVVPAQAAAPGRAAGGRPSRRRHGRPRFDGAVGRRGEVRRRARRSSRCRPTRRVRRWRRTPACATHPFPTCFALRHRARGGRRPADLPRPGAPTPRRSHPGRGHLDAAPEPRRGLARLRRRPPPRLAAGHLGRARLRRRLGRRPRPTG